MLGIQVEGSVLVLIALVIVVRKVNVDDVIEGSRAAVNRTAPPTLTNKVTHQSQPFNARRIANS
ncbi:hypothetical protein N7541_007646 [Penicillium brevicompactum]|uniref:Secreted protein n=1 Tax=Penicillium brevicompactum TaxID=5074 RepID=A0A9W9QZY7_PENBR|nr:hypothetical protein N7541_007646 [Penicillium brevicompactum]